MTDDDGRARTAAGRWLARQVFMVLCSCSDGLMWTSRAATATADRINRPAMRAGVRAHGRRRLDAAMDAALDGEGGR